MGGGRQGGEGQRAEIGLLCAPSVSLGGYFVRILL